MKSISRIKSRVHLVSMNERPLRIPEGSSFFGGGFSFFPLLLLLLLVYLAGQCIFSFTQVHGGCVRSEYREDESIRRSALQPQTLGQKRSEETSCSHQRKHSAFYPRKGITLDLWMFHLSFSWSCTNYFKPLMYLQTQWLAVKTLEQINSKQLSPLWQKLKTQYNTFSHQLFLSNFVVVE